MRVSNKSKLTLALLALGTWQQHAIAQESQTTAAETDQARIPELTSAERQEAETLVQDVVERARQAQQEEQQAQPAVPQDAIRINHVPDFIKEEIRAQVRADLRADVLQDVLTQAKNEQWGLPNALPGWVNRVSVKGDLRMRAQSDNFADTNVAGTYIDIAAVNDAGGLEKAGPEKYLNNTIDRERLRVRARLGVDAKVTQNVKAGLRLSTGNQQDPVSTNLTLGNNGNRSQVMWDQLYLKYDGYDADRYPWMTVWAGRMPNPWLSTDLVWDSDLAFEGLAGSFRFNLRGSDSLLDMNERDRTLYLTLGAFPLQEVELSKDDKWLYGAQAGTEFIFRDQSTLNVALGYYVYDNITGVRNTVNESTDMDYTAPGFMQKGNLLYNIRESVDTTAQLWALAAEYRQLNLTVEYDIARYAPHHVVLSADIVKNVGYDQQEIEDKVQGIVERSQSWDVDVGPTKPRTLGYQIGATVGWPSVTQPRNWNVSLFYKYLERDAVLDAYTDSDFHLGGTDAKGWVLGGNYGLLENTWLSARLLSSDSIDGEVMGVDTIQIDWNAKF